MRGRPVVSADGTVVGTIAELFIGSSDWRIEAIGVELRNDVADRIGEARTIFHHAKIELPVSLIQSVSDAVVLTVDLEHLREVNRPVAAEETPQPTT
ncbi:MAG TPA: PRC-barrel domain-containing protein [Kofleriaceae bacterium]|nr:PRC-barrel domain-containing protein [Kofleriaceae bacterium]